MTIITSTSCTPTEMRQLKAEASAIFLSKEGQTVMSDRFARAPLKWSRAFSDGPDGAVSVYLQDVSPGWMDGDEYRIRISCEPGSKVSLRTTTYGKIHPAAAGGPGTSLDQQITVKDARFSYCPEPLIPFRDADFTARTNIRLSGNVQLFWSECFAPGRVHKGEQFQYRKLDTLTEIELDGRLIVWDPFRFQPGIQDHMAHGAWENYSHCATIWLVDPISGQERLNELIQEWQQLRENKKEMLPMAASLLDGPALTIRMAARTAADLQLQIWEIWQHVRQTLWNEHHPVWTAPGEQPDTSANTLVPAGSS